MLAAANAMASNARITSIFLAVDQHSVCVVDDSWGGGRGGGEAERRGERGSLFETKENEFQTTSAANDSRRCDMDQWRSQTIAVWFSGV